MSPELYSDLIKLIFTFLALYLVSCSINGTTQGLYGYQKVTESIMPEFISPLQGDICMKDLPNTLGVTKINGLDIYRCLSQDVRTVVYLWPPKCSSAECISPILLSTFCSDLKVNLFIVAEYYDYPIMYANLTKLEPIYAIDQRHYNTNLTKKYKTRFLNDLGISNKTTITENRFFYFENTQFIHANSDIELHPWVAGQ